MIGFAWNNRKAIRFFFQSQASVRLHRSSKKDIQLNTKTLSAKLLDLSAGGCSLESAALLPSGAKINIFFDRDLLLNTGRKSKKRHYSKIVGVVRNSSQLRNRKYRLGIQFEKISSEDKKFIHAFVGRHDRREERRIAFPS